MTNSDQMMLAAIGSRAPFRINGREVAVDGETTTVTLHGERIAELDFGNQSMVLYGTTPVSRKSTRVFNAILKEHTLFSMQSRDGQWILRGPFGILTPVGTGRITVPMKNKYVYDKVY